MIKVGLIGYGYWGPNLLRNFANVDNCKVEMVCDLRQSRLDEVNKIYPTIHCTTEIKTLIKSPKVDAVLIATPVFTHFDFARMSLENGKSVLIEKPMTASTEEAIKLIELAEKKNLLLMVDHTFLYTSAVQKIKKIIELGTLGGLKYFASTRINLGLFQSDINVLWDLAPHDISILNYIIGEKPESVNATGTIHTNNGIENIAYLTLNYKSGFIAHLNCSWSSPVKIRMMLIGGDKKNIVFNDLEPTEKLKIYDAGYTFKNDEEKGNILVDYRIGDIFVPKIDNTEALMFMAKDFIDSIIDNKIPLSNMNSAFDVVKILESSDKSIKNKGIEVKLN